MIALVLGGARSGKSAVAERLAMRLPQPVTYIATTPAADTTMAARIAAHRARRPARWATIESDGRLPDELAGLEGSVLIDALGPWLAGQEGFRVDAARLCAVLRERAGDTVVVSEEVGLGVHPSSDAGRAFRDALGVLNQAVAEVADDVMLIVAGRRIRLDEP